MYQNCPQLAQADSKKDWKLIKFYLGMWIYKSKVEAYAKEQGISISDVMRLAINEFFKDKPTI